MLPPGYFTWNINTSYLRNTEDSIAIASSNNFRGFRSHNCETPATITIRTPDDLFNKKQRKPFSLPRFLAVVIRQTMSCYSPAGPLASGPTRTNRGVVPSLAYVASSTSQLQPEMGRGKIDFRTNMSPW